MNSTIMNDFDFAELAQAAYSNLNPSMDQDAFIAALQVEAGAGMSLRQAQQFADAYQIIDQSSRNATSGFSATVFANGDQYIIAMRGTQGFFTIDGAIDWLRADIADVGGNGIAVHQAIDLFNYFQNLTVQAGSTVYQYAYDDNSQEITRTSFTATANGKLFGKNFAVTGHSLGGQLALIMSRLAPDRVSAVYTYNAPGFDTNADPFVGGFSPLGSNHFFDLLRVQEIAALGSSNISSVWDPAKLNNLVVPEDIIHRIGTVPGGPLALYSEGGSRTAPISSHDYKKMNDALAVYNLFATIDPGLNTDPNGIATISGMLRAASNVAANTLESVISAVGKLFSVPNTTFTGNEFDTNRDLLYTSLDNIKKALPVSGGLQLKSLVGLDANDVASLAASKTGAISIAYRYALKEMNPFVITGADYNRFDQKGALDLFNSATGNGELTQKYLTDRAQFLVQKISFNISDGARVPRGTTLYQDLASGLELRPTVIQQKYIFGGDGNDAPQFSAGDDHIYGGAGDDEISGGGGNDYLEGNAGNDKLFGDEGNDTLVGGTGDDVLNGDEGNDILRAGSGDSQLSGGPGNDTYEISGTGTKHLIDSQTDLAGDNVFFIEPDGTRKNLAGLFIGTSAQNTWTSPDGSLTITHSSPYTITDNQTGAQAVVDNFQDGDFGIHLEDAFVAPTTTRDIMGDFAPIVFPDGFHFDELGNLITDHTLPVPLADTLNDSAANDHIIGGERNDVIDAFRGGDDQIETGAGQDIVSAGPGNDVIQGGADANILDGGTGNDEIYADTQIDLATAINSTGQPAISGQGDFLTGGAGDDTVIGSNRSDALFGGEGSDILVGGAGDDFLAGDLDFLAGDFSWTRTRSIEGGIVVDNFTDRFDRTDPSAGGDDVLYGGDGNDDMVGGAGDDYLSGDSGDDFIAGDAGNDVILGGTGNDFLIGDNIGLSASQQGNDYLDGGEGNDTITGQGGEDVLLGGAGTDFLEGDSGDDSLDGGTGDDTLLGGMGEDTLLGGDGNDQIAGDNGGTDPSGDADFIDAGAGDDIVDGQGGDDTLLGGDGNDTLVGGDGNDLLDGGAGADLMQGGAGDDQLTGGDGNDTLLGGDGNDTLDGGAGADILRGGAGDDTYVADTSDTIDDSEGNNHLILAGFSDASELDVTTSTDDQGQSELIVSAANAAQTIPGIPDGLHIKGDISALNLDFQFEDGAVLTKEQFLNAAFTRHVSLVGGGGDDVLEGFGGDDRLNGDQGNDTLIGGAGNDRLFGEDGNDNLRGDAGDDTLTGGVGSDTYVFARGDGLDVIADAGTVANGTPDFAGTDTIQFAQDILATDVTLSRRANGDLVIDYGNGDQVTVQGQFNNTANRIERIVFGDGSALTSDFLNTLPIAPIVGTEQNDTLTGTPADETLMGLGGNDTYAFGAGMGRDTWIDTGANTIALQAGLTFADVTTSQTGNDLLLTLGSGHDGAIIKDYFLGNQDWTLQDTNGATQSLAERIAEEAQQVFADQEFNQARSALKASIVSSYLAQGYQLTGPGQFDQGLRVTQPPAAFYSGSDSTTVTEFHSIPSGVISPLGSSHVSTANWNTNLVFEFHNTASLVEQAIVSDDPFINGGFSGLPRTQNSTQGTVDVSWGRPNILSNEFSIHPLSDQLVAGPPPDNRIIGFTTGAITRHTFSATVNGQAGAFHPNGIPSDGAFPAQVRATKFETQETNTIGEIDAGDSANTIFAGARTLVKAGGGNDTVTGGYFVDGGAGDDVITGAKTAYGGEGNDKLFGADFFSGGDTLIGGSGINLLVNGREFQIDPNQSNTDLVIGGLDTIPDEETFRERYYPAIGIADWEFRFDHGGKFHDFEGGTDFDSFDEAVRHFDDLGVPSEGTGVHFVEPLPPLPALPDANDFAALAQPYALGIIQPDQLQFPDVVKPTDLNLTWGQVVANISGVDTDPKTLYTTLDINFGNHTERVLIPHADDPVGSAVENFVFSDGTTLTLQQLIALAPPAPSFDPQTIGTDGDDHLVGLRGRNTTLNGGAGNDTLIGNTGNDTLLGGDGNDTLLGGEGNDLLDGGAGNDQLQGEAGDDMLLGGAGDDKLFGEGNDILDGGVGDDQLFGGGILTGGAGNNLLVNGREFRIDPNHPNTDLMIGGLDTIFGQEDFPAHYYPSIGIPDWQFHLDHGGKFYDQLDNRDFASFDEAVNYFSGLGVNFTPDQIAGFVHFVEPLPPLPTLPAANDFAALAPLYALGIIQQDQLRFPDGVSLADINLSWGQVAANISGVDTDPKTAYTTLDISFGDHLERVLIPHTDDPVGSAVENFVFSDGTTLNLQQLIALAPPAPSFDPQNLDNVLFGSASNDILTGGAGNDTLIGGAGNDTYVINPGDGVDHIQDSSGNNTIAFGAGITPDSISLGLGSLLLHLDNQGDAIHIDDFDPNDVFANPSISNFQFSDGTVLSYNELIAKGFDITGTTGDDTLTGTNVDDRINGLGGNDSLNGGAGSNTYIFDPGFGHDVVVNPSNQGSIQFTNGIAPSDISVSRDGLDLLLTDKSGNEVRLSNWYADANSSPIQQAIFTDGTVWNAPTLDSMAAQIVQSPDLILVGSNGKNTLRGGAGNDLLEGGKGNDILKGDGGNDILEGGDGKDVLKDKSGNNLFYGGRGDDRLTGGNGNDLLIGGKGDDTITTGKGSDIIAFNRGDGKDTLNPSRGEDNTLSLGGGIRYKDLALSRHDNDLIVEVGKGEKIKLEDWYASSKYESVLNLQVITDASKDYDPNSSNPLFNQRVNDFDFTALVDQFDKAKAANKNLAHWSVMNSLLDAHLAGSDTEALGGDLAYQYGKNGTLAGIGLSAAQDVLNSPQFGTQAQTLRPLATLQQGTIKLS